jgi:molybdopterin molybdotransferase
VNRYIDVEVAKALIEATLPAPAAVVMPLDKARGRVLAADLKAMEDLPPFANSAMDGYAVRAAEVAGACEDSPVTLPLSGEIAAGGNPDIDWPAGSVLRIMTGAPAPEGCEGVIPVERTTEADGAVIFSTDLEATGDNLRPAGEDVKEGAPLLAAGTRLGPAALALLAAQGMVDLPVWRRPRVSFLATGSELVSAEETPGPGGIRNSNGPLALALLTEAGFPAQDLGIGPDDPDRLRELLGEALASSDLLITTGGVSMGRYDLVGDLLVELGAEWVFHKVKQQPGKPLAFLEWQGKPVFGLPGNPVSSFMTLWYYVLPALRTMAGEASPEPLRVEALLAGEVRGRPSKLFFARAFTEWTPEGWRATPCPPHGSHVLSSLTRANSFLLLPPGTGDLAEGATVTAAFFGAFGP